MFTLHTYIFKYGLPSIIGHSNNDLFSLCQRNVLGNGKVVTSTSPITLYPSFYIDGVSPLLSISPTLSLSLILYRWRARILSLYYARAQSEYLPFVIIYRSRLSPSPLLVLLLLLLLLLLFVLLLLLLLLLLHNSVLCCYYRATL